MKQTPLKRKTALLTRTVLTRKPFRSKPRDPALPKSGKPRSRAGDIPPKVRKQVLARADGACEACGMAFMWAPHLHHRRLRSQGGEHTVENLIAVHGETCHVRIHAHPIVSRRLGLIVARGSDPASVAVSQWPETSE